MLVPQLDQEFKTASLNPEKSGRLSAWIHDFYGIDYNEFVKRLAEKKIR
jgi:hypothetical protein